MVLAALVGTAAAVPEPELLCTVTDRRLAELSGLVVDAAGGIWAIPDGGRRVTVHRIDPVTCAIVETRTADIDPRDAEDLALGPDGALWVGDIGDNGRVRDTVAVIVLPEQGEPRLHRLTYPDGAHDAEALVVDGAGRPVIVTKEGPFGAGVYRTVEPPAGVGPTPLERVGTAALPASNGTTGPLGGLGSRLVTGAAQSADGSVVALRSYTDAWLYPVRDGDVAAAVTGAAAVRVPLPDEPQGEAIAFGPDGTLYSAGETRNGVRGELRAVRGAAALVAGGDAVFEPSAAEEPSSGPVWGPAVIGGGIVTGLLLLLALAMGLRGRRRA